MSLYWGQVILCHTPSPLLSSPGFPAWLSAPCLDSVAQTCLDCALYKNRPRRLGLGASILDQEVAFGRGNRYACHIHIFYNPVCSGKNFGTTSLARVYSRYQMPRIRCPCPLEPLCQEPLRSRQGDRHSSWVHYLVVLLFFKSHVCLLIVIFSIHFPGGCGYWEATPILPQHSGSFGKPLGSMFSEPTPRVFLQESFLDSILLNLTLIRNPAQNSYLPKTGGEWTKDDLTISDLSL